jgi:hypothetical protein
MKRAFRIFGLLVLSAATILYVAINYSAVVREYTCNGELVRRSERQEDKAFLALEEYRWWVSLWSKDTDGNLKFQTDKTRIFDYVSTVEKLFEGNLTAYHLKSDDGSKLIGTFRIANGEFSLSLTGDASYSGRCEALS